MVITKQTNKEQEIKKYFKEAKQIQETIKNTIDSRYKFLSMVMSKDYMLGVLLGAFALESRQHYLPKSRFFQNVPVLV